MKRACHDLHSFLKVLKSLSWSKNVNGNISSTIKESSQESAIYSDSNFLFLFFLLNIRKPSTKEGTGVSSEKFFGLSLRVILRYII
ncbi:hypothetical protein EUTSA_v10010001mg [Eutrema salsugineum]|uniref:Uncharacterized protein n=1 Tax=Eutrema salsugineum TaxID=72664 RepID=V4L6I3_EUTSA|nr:hypothetical protein EUTSA_v10010001mg [Eutrema salsugineum]